MWVQLAISCFALLVFLGMCYAMHTMTQEDHHVYP